MDYKQFIGLMKKKTPDRDSIPLLQEFVKEFPYFQSAQALLARAMFDQQHVRYDRQLKISAAYAGDRTALYNLINRRKPIAISEDSISAEVPQANLVPEKIQTTFHQPNETPFEEDEDETQAGFYKNLTTAPESSEENENIFLETEIIPADNSEQEIAFTNESEKIDEIIPVPFHQKNYYEAVDFSEESIPDFDDEPTPSDPHEIIKRRLNEILGVKGTNAESKTEEAVNDKTLSGNLPEEKKSSEEKNEQREIAEPVLNEKQTDTIYPVSNDTILDSVEERIVSEASSRLDVVQKGELEYALEGSVLNAIEKLPPLERKPKENLPVQEKSDTNVPHNFLGWLKSKPVQGFGIVEEVHADEDETLSATTNIGKSIAQDDIRQSASENKEVDQIFTSKIISPDPKELIEKFITTEPKIVPSKNEFYSPVTQAKKSVTEDEDLVSETLAKIYLMQGAFPKARSAYQKLSLLYPEKLAYFAALISEIDKEQNTLDNQDL